MRKSAFGIQQPVGYCIVPKWVEPEYQALPEEQWSDYRKKNKEMRGFDFESLHEELYEKKKDTWIQREQTGQMGLHHQHRFEEAVKLGELKVFQDATNRKQQRIIARQFHRNMTEAEIDEVVEIARMGITLPQLEKALNIKRVDDDHVDMKPLKQSPKNVAAGVGKSSGSLPESKS